MIKTNKDAMERYEVCVQIDTQSDPQSNTHPSTENKSNPLILIPEEQTSREFKDA